MKKMFLAAAFTMMIAAANNTAQAQATSVMAGTVQVIYTGRFNAYAQGYKPIDTVTYNFGNQAMAAGVVEAVGSHYYFPKVALGLALYKVTTLMGFTALIDKEAKYCIYIINEDKTVGAITFTWIIKENQFRIDYLSTDDLKAYNKNKREQIVLTGDSYAGK